MLQRLNMQRHISYSCRLRNKQALLYCASPYEVTVVITVCIQCRLVNLYENISTAS